MTEAGSGQQTVEPHVRAAMRYSDFMAAAARNLDEQALGHQMVQASLIELQALRERDLGAFSATLDAIRIVNPDMLRHILTEVLPPEGIDQQAASK